MGEVPPLTADYTLDDLAAHAALALNGALAELQRDLTAEPVETAEE